MHILHTFYVSAFELADDDKIQSSCKNELRKVAIFFTDTVKSQAVVCLGQQHILRFSEGLCCRNLMSVYYDLWPKTSKIGQQTGVLLATLRYSYSSQEQRIFGVLFLRSLQMLYEGGRWVRNWEFGSEKKMSIVNILIIVFMNQVTI